jgi:hypothetical protein
MAESFLLFLSYLAEPSHEYSGFFKDSFATDDPEDPLALRDYDGSEDIVDVSSSMSYHSIIQWIEILSGTYKAPKIPQQQVSAMELPNRSHQKARSVSSHSFEMGESSRNPSISHRLTESADGETTSGSGSLKEADNSNPNRINGASSSSQITVYGNLGTEGDVELDVLMRGSAREIDELSEGKTSGLGKGKQPIRPTVIDISLLGGKIDPNRLDDKGKQPLRSALKRPFSPYIIPSNRHGDTWLMGLNRPSSHTSRTTVQFESGQFDQFDTEQDRTGKNKRIGDRKKEIIESEGDESEEDQEYDDNDDGDLDDMELNGLLKAVLNANPGSAISVKPYTSSMTGQDVFLFNHGIVIARNDPRKLLYGVAIPGKIFRRKKSRYPSTSALLMDLAKINLDILDIGTANPELIRKLILEDAEEAYREAKYGHTTWLGIIEERKSRRDPETRQWKSIFYPTQWRRHGLVLPEGQAVSLFPLRCSQEQEADVSSHPRIAVSSEW